MSRLIGGLFEAEGVAEGVFELFKAEEVVAGVVFPDYLFVLREELQQRRVVAQQVVVEAEGEIEWCQRGVASVAAVMHQGLEYTPVEVGIEGREGLDLGAVAGNEAYGAEHVAHGVDCPDGALEPGGGAEGMIAAEAAADEERDLMLLDERVQLLLYLPGRQVVVVDCRREHFAFAKELAEEASFGGVAVRAVAMNVHDRRALSVVTHHLSVVESYC